MEVIDENKNKGFYCQDENFERNRKRNKVFIGVAIISAGIILLLKRSGVEIPGWLLSWPMIVIAVGIGSAIKHGFKRIHSYIIMAIGGLFLFEKIAGITDLHIYIWPVALMFIGLMVIFKPKRKHKWEEWHNHYSKKKCRLVLKKEI